MGAYSNAASRAAAYGRGVQGMGGMGNMPPGFPPQQGAPRQMAIPTPMGGMAGMSGGTPAMLGAIAALRNPQPQTMPFQASNPNSQPFPASTPQLGQGPMTGLQPMQQQQQALAAASGMPDLGVMTGTPNQPRENPMSPMATFNQLGMGQGSVGMGQTVPRGTSKSAGTIPMGTRK